MMTLRRSPVRSDPALMGDALVFRASRVPAQTLPDYLDDGYTLGEFLETFPSVDRGDAEAFLRPARGDVPGTASESPGAVGGRLGSTGVRARPGLRASGKNVFNRTCQTRVLTGGSSASRRAVAGLQADAAPRATRDGAGACRWSNTGRVVACGSSGRRAVSG